MAPYKSVYYYYFFEYFYTPGSKDPWGKNKKAKIKMSDAHMSCRSTGVVVQKHGVEALLLLLLLLPHRLRLLGSCHCIGLILAF